MDSAKLKRLLAGVSIAGLLSVGGLAYGQGTS
jgi:radical SAM modification target selenobiotic family peptide